MYIFALIIRYRQLIQKSLKETGVTKFYSKIRNTSCQCLNSSSNNLKVCTLSRNTQKLYTSLHNLVASACQTKMVAVDSLVIIQTQGLVGVLQAGRDHSGDRQGRIRSHHHQSALFVTHFVHTFHRDARNILFKQVIKFQRRRQHLMKPSARKDISKHIGHGTVRKTIFKKQVFRTFGRDLCIIFHPHHLIFFLLFFRLSFISETDSRHCLLR